MLVCGRGLFSSIQPSIFYQLLISLFFFFSPHKLTKGSNFQIATINTKRQKNNKQHIHYNITHNNNPPYILIFFISKIHIKINIIIISSPQHRPQKPTKITQNTDKNNYPQIIHKYITPLFWHKAPIGVNGCLAIIIITQNY